MTPGVQTFGSGFGSIFSLLPTLVPSQGTLERRKQLRFSFQMKHHGFAHMYLFAVFNCFCCYRPRITSATPHNILQCASVSRPRLGAYLRRPDSSSLSVHHLEMLFTRRFRFSGSGGAQGSAFPASSQVLLALLVRGPHFE